MEIGNISGELDAISATHGIVTSCRNWRKDRGRAVLQAGRGGHDGGRGEEAGGERG